MKTYLSIFFIIFIFILSGCETMQDVAILFSDIDKDKDYQIYQEKLVNGEVSDDGYYQVAENKINDYLVTKLQSEGKIHVTFAENPLLSIDYFSDEKLSEEIDVTQCLLNPGDMIFASKVNNLDLSNELYHFTGFEIWEYGQRNSERKLIQLSESKEGLIFKIPEKYEGKELQIVPIGKYDNRQVILDAYYFENGDKVELAQGQWTMNEERKENGEIEADPTKPYRLKYDYSFYKDIYYPFISNPEWYYQNTINHTVIFNEVSTGDKKVYYGIEFRRYKNIEFDFSGLPWNLANHYDLSIKYDGKDDKLVIARNSLVDSGKQLEYKKNFKGGDRLIITVPEVIRLSSIDLNIGNGIRVEEGFKYDIVIPEKPVELFHIFINLRNKENSHWVSKEMQNGIITVLDSNNKPLHDGDEIPYDNDKITVKIIPNDGFYVAGSKKTDDSYEAQINYSELEKFLEQHPIEQKLSVQVDDNSLEGTCIFRVDGVPVSGLISIRKDQIITLDFVLKEDSAYQIAHSDNVSGLIEKIFTKNKISVQIPLEWTNLYDLQINCMDYVILQEK